MATDSNASGGSVFGALDSISNFLRTLLALAVAGAVGFAGWIGYNHYAANDLAQRELQVKTQELAEKDKQLAAKDQELAAKTQENSVLQATNTQLQAENRQLTKDLRETQEQLRISEVKRKLLTVDHRIAQIKVLDQELDAATGQQFTRIEFVEQNDEGQPIEKPREFKLKGDMVYVDYWVVKFDDKYVESADLLRGTSICLFRRIFSSKQEPDDGYVLDEVNSRPTAYSRGGAPNEFEEKIWRDFWEIANNPDRAKELGIREAHGDAVSVKLVPGKKYRLMLRASGGPSIAPEPDAPAAQGTP